MTGRISEAIDTTQSLYPGLLDQNSDLFFKLKCRQFIEMVNGCDGEVKTYAHSPSRSVRNSPCVSPSRPTSSIGSNVSSAHVYSNRVIQSNNSVDNVEQPNGVSRNGRDEQTMLLDDCTSNGVCDNSTNNEHIPQDGAEAMDTSDEIKCSSSTNNSSSAVSVITNSSKGENSLWLFCITSQDLESVLFSSYMDFRSDERMTFLIAQVFSTPYSPLWFNQHYIALNRQDKLQLKMMFLTIWRFGFWNKCLDVDVFIDFFIVEISEFVSYVKLWNLPWAFNALSTD